MKLFDYWRSSSTWRVRIALNYKGVAFEQLPVDLDVDEQLRAPYAEENPLRQVPALELVVDGKTVLLTQSLAIIELLDELHPSPRCCRAHRSGGRGSVNWRRSSTPASSRSRTAT